MKVVDTPELANEWIVSAQPGSQCIYYTGLLMRARAQLDPALPTPPPLIVARRMWSLYVAGRVTLVQKRLSEFNYQYIAQKVI